jgi:hypothetical protein
MIPPWEKTEPKGTGRKSDSLTTLLAQSSPSFLIRCTDSDAPEVTMRPQFFKVISGDTFYMGKEGKESEAGSFYLGSVLVASVGGTERRMLERRACAGSPVQNRN